MDIKGTLKAKIDTPLRCWDIYSLSLLDHFNVDSKKVVLQELSQYQREFGWQVDLKELLRARYDGLVLTDHHVNIQWVDNGFCEMTGYSKKEIINNSPLVLQGAATTHSSKQRIREKLLLKKPFQEDIVNYKKSGDLYTCRLQVYPLFDKQGHLSHFFALENEIK